MKKFLTLLTAGILAFGLNAKPEREGGKKGGPPEGRPSREEVMKKILSVLRAQKKVAVDESIVRRHWAACDSHGRPSA